MLHQSGNTVSIEENVGARLQPYIVYGLGIVLVFRNNSHQLMHLLEFVLKLVHIRCYFVPVEGMPSRLTHFSVVNSQDTSGRIIRDPGDYP